ncbi:hypothetical protein RE6C_01862 [Rhodopirellula europaea 6C]|uniref:Uncharacterized protein n=1 Tax=Rhodopirellula europaea 6C TaxID=1263867 RepID=M2B526_9BACT|nr:hypothetical protein RE6C_01862 [Rhodopirellula europaea 6C]
MNHPALLSGGRFQVESIPPAMTVVKSVAFLARQRLNLGGFGRLGGIVSVQPSGL